MERNGPETGQETALAEVLGYLNFSSGTPDPRFRRHLNDLYRGIEYNPADAHRPWGMLRSLLADKLRDLAKVNDTFQHPEQARAVVDLAFGRVLEMYREFHRDLLHHQADEELFRPFFLARVCETVLQVGGPWDEYDRIIHETIARLNDFIGYRPIATLHTKQKLEPYDHEWVAPIPLYLRGVGVGTGRFHDLLSLAIEILKQTDREVLDMAWFDPELLDELALDPRAYDFDHPANKRPNYHFGQWDPHAIDAQGRYRRYVLQGVTLDAIWQWTRESGESLERERLFEAAAVISGTILMGSAMSGSGPETHDSTITLAKLMPRIAKCRDQFYERLLSRMSGNHATRLRDEATTLKQPFGGVRQHLNTTLARLRATQLQHVHLAQLFARMGFPESSHRQAEIVPVASARMLCAINSLLTGGHHALDRAQAALSAECLQQIEKTLLAAIECGALVDPWNMLGFQGQFSLFHALENSIRDHRVDVLVHLMRQVFGLYARTIGEAAATGKQELEQQLVAGMTERAQWWDNYASADIHGLDSFRALDMVESAKHVAAALGAWHRAGEAAGDLAFWREHVARFNSAKSYALVVDALLQKRDFIASRALLVQWLSQNEVLPLVEGEYSFSSLAVRWMRMVHDVGPTLQTSLDDRWTLTRKLFDYFEANADTYWEVPAFEWERAPKRAPPPTVDPLEDDDLDVDDLAEDDFDEDDFDEDTDFDESDDFANDEFAAEDESAEDEASELFSAAYEDVTYRDSTADGFDGSTLEAGPDPTDDQLEHEAHRISQRLQFLGTLAQSWRLAAIRTMGRGILGAGEPAGRSETIKEWIAQARAYQQGLADLLQSVESYQISNPRGSPEALIEYDRRRRLREGLLARIVTASVEMIDATRHMLASIDQRDVPSDLPEWEQQAIHTLRAMYRGDVTPLATHFAELRASLDQQPILYVPLSRNGRAQAIVACRSTQQLIVTLLRGLPRLGMIGLTCQLIVTAQAMERHRPRGEGFVTEFDRLFEVGYRAIIESVIHAFPEDPHAGTHSDHELIDLLQTLTESLLKHWLTHSRSLRLSVLEKVNDKQRWAALQKFIERYGDETFTARWMNLGNLRAIAHKGVDAYLTSVADEQDLPAGLQRLVDELAAGVDVPGTIDRAEVVQQLTLVIEAVIENYGEYKDYNNTTTQSDHGEQLYALLDFLRVKASYQRFAWTIKPVNLAHEVLVRCGRMAAAELWRRAVAQKTADVADWHQKRWQELCRNYGMRLPTIGDLLSERFVRPLAIDRVKSLVRPAIDELRRGEPTTTFHLLEQEIAEFTDHPTGSGLDVPTWLQALEEEAELALTPWGHPDVLESEAELLPWSELSRDEIQQQIRSWEPTEEGQ